MSKERKSEEKARYSATTVIMRQLFHQKQIGQPGYLLLQDVIYKHLEGRDQTLDELVKWSKDHSERSSEIRFWTSRNLAARSRKNCV